MKPVVVTLCAIALSTIFIGCGQIPRLDVKPALQNGRVVFDVPHRGINGILGFRVQDEAGNPLWAVTTSYEAGHRIVYGVVPPGNNMAARQEFPADNQPPADIRGKTVKVLVNYQFDRMVPLGGTFEKTVKIP